MKIFVLRGVLLAALCLQVHCLPAAEHDELQRAPADSLRATLEDLRCRMHVGIPEMDVPPLDPFQMEYFRLDLIQDLGIAVNLYDLHATGLNQFVINQLDVTILGGNAMKMNITVPHLQITGRYDMYGSIEGLITVSGEGDFSADIYGFEVYTDAALPFANGKFSISDLTIMPSVEKLNLRLENFMDGGEVGDFFLEALNELAPDILQELWPDFEAEIAELIKSMADVYLAEISLGQMNGSNSLLPPPTEEIVGGVCAE